VASDSADSRHDVELPTTDIDRVLVYLQPFCFESDVQYNEI
jgi:hypothetical protein